MLGKLLSGRYILTMAVAFVFVYAALTKQLSPAETIAVIMFVIQAYFNKDRSTPTGEQK
jgi:hypothetical protein